MVDAGFVVGRVEVQRRVIGRGQIPVAEGGNLFVKTRADPRHLRLRDPRVGTESLHQVITLPGRHPVQIRLHQHREQGPFNPPSMLQQRRKKSPLTLLRHR